MQASTDSVLNGTARQSDWNMLNPRSLHTFNKTSLRSAPIWNGESMTNFEMMEAMIKWWKLYSRRPAAARRHS